MQITVNGRVRVLDIDPAMPLLWALRDHLGLTGTKYGCGFAQCGACTVSVDGVALRSCAHSVGEIAGRAVVTIEGAHDRIATAVLSAWDAAQVAQCGYCQPGQVMAATALLRAEPRPDDAAIDRAMAGNACRCATYVRIRAAIHAAAAALAA